MTLGRALAGVSISSCFCHALLVICISPGSGRSGAVKPLAIVRRHGIVKLESPWENLAGRAQHIPIAQRESCIGGTEDSEGRANDVREVKMEPAIAAYGEAGEVRGNYDQVRAAGGKNSV